MKTITTDDLKLSPFSGISQGWYLVCAGDEKKNNFMTAAWGFLGHMWRKDCVIVGVRPQRYTYEFMEKYDTFSVCLMDGEYKEDMAFCGSKSGRDYNKAAETGFTVEFRDGTPYVPQAKYVLICRKRYADSIKEENFTTDGFGEMFYPDGDFHKLFFGEITEALGR